MARLSVGNGMFNLAFLLDQSRKSLLEKSNSISKAFSSAAGSLVLISLASPPRIPTADEST
jgi:hypothetical protein